MSQAALDELVTALGPEQVLTRAESMEAYRHDWTHDASAGAPLAVVRPTNAEQVQATVGWAARQAGQLLDRSVRVRTTHAAEPGGGLTVTAELVDA